MKNKRKSRNKQELFLRFITILGAVSVALFWYFGEKLGFSIGDLLIYSGIYLLVVASRNLNKKKTYSLSQLNCSVENNRKTIGTDSYTGDLIFFE